MRFYLLIYFNFLFLLILGWLWCWKQCLSYFESSMVCSAGFSTMKVLFSSSSFSSNVGARPVLQEVLSGLFYSPETVIACRPQIMLVASVQDTLHTGQP